MARRWTLFWPNAQLKNGRRNGSLRESIAELKARWRDFHHGTALDLTLGVLATLWLIFFAYYLEESYECLNNCSFLG